MQTVGDILAVEADAAGIPLRTLDQVRDCLVKAKKYGSDMRMAAMMRRFGRLTDEARGYVERYLEVPS